MGYFDHPYVNNSALSKLDKELRGDETPEPFEAYRFGSLFDCVVTEPEKLDRYRNTIAGTNYTFTAAELEVAERMYTSVKKDPFCAQLLKSASKQVEVYVDDVAMEWQSIKFSLPMKCKYDFHTPTLFADLKSTKATSKQQFVASCELFNYWRQMALYGRLGSLTRAMIIGVSQVNYQVFLVPLAHTDANWRKGTEQYTELAYKYWLFKKLS